VRNEIDQPRTGSNATTLLGAAAIGAGLMYLFDPVRGRRRRRLLTDQLVHATRVLGEAAGTTKRDVANRSRGLAMEFRARFGSDDADDEVVEQRVRSTLGRVVSHPRALEVVVDDGRVRLRGPVLADEADTLVRRVANVRGVVDLEDELDRYDSPEGVPALQGGDDPPRPSGIEAEWTPTARLLSGIAGSALVAYGSRRRGPIGMLAAVAGAALFTRGTTNHELGRLVGAQGRRGVDIVRTIEIDAPLDEVFAWFADWEQWPHWMSHVRQVRSSGAPLDGPRIGERTHWVVDGPAGVPVEWDAVVTRFVPSQRVSWRTVEGAAVRHAGTLQFEPSERGGTRVQIRMTYAPPAGVVGHGIAALLGRDPRHQLDDDLARLKSTIETGRPPHDAAARTTAGPRTGAAPDTGASTFAEAEPETRIE
jgi:uncharacterized membrane protein